jgi:2'-5' RNA ligase
MPFPEPTDFSAERPRVFLAVPFSHDFKNRLATYQDALKERFKAMHWIPPENFHLTLKFFGETPLGKLTERIMPRLRTLLADAPAFDVSFDGFGFFGTPNRPRVVYLHGTAPGLQATAETVLKEFPDEKPRPFKPHLTLGKPLRKQTPDDRRINEMMFTRWKMKGPETLDLPKVAESAHIVRLNLMESVFVGRAVHYADRAEFRLE